MILDPESYASREFVDGFYACFPIVTGSVHASLCFGNRVLFHFESGFQTVWLETDILGQAT